MDEFDRDRILGFLVTISLFGIILGELGLFGEDRGFEDDDSENGLLYVSLGEEIWDNTLILFVGEESSVSLD